MRTFIASGAAAALALLLATPALARTDSKAEAGTEQSGSGAATAAADERKVCKVLEMTGARTKNKRVCLTREEWRKIDDAD